MREHRDAHFRSAISIGLFLCFLWSCGSPPPNPPPQKPGISETWYGAYLGGQHVGFLRQLTTHTPEGGLRLYSENFISAKSLDQPVQMRMIETLEASASLRPEKYFQKIDAGIGSPYLVRGERRGDQFHIEVESAGKAVKTKTFSIGDLTFPQLADQMIHTEDLAVGKNWTFQIINPVDFLPIRITISVDKSEPALIEGDTKNLFQVTTKMGMVEIQAFVDTSSIDPYRIVMPAMGLEYVRMDKKTAGAVSADAPANLDLAYFSAVIPAGGQIPPDEILRLRVRLHGAPLEGLDLTGDYQKTESAKMKDTVLDIRLPVMPLPDERGSARTQISGETAHASILKIAKRLHRPTPLAFCKEAFGWMQTNIRQIPTSIVPGAAEVLELKQGDCNEFSALFQALAESAGHSCKIVSGVVYVGDRFFYHSWNELNVKDRWIPVDPILNEIPASPKHIKLIEGDFSASWKLAGVIRTLKIDILTD